MAQAPKRLTPHRSLWHYVGAELRHWRERAELSQDELGGRVHFSGDAVSRVEKAERTPNAALIEACDRELQAGGALVRLLKLAEHVDTLDARVATGDGGGGAGAPSRAHPSAADARDTVSVSTTWTVASTGELSTPIQTEAGRADALVRALMRRNVTASTVGALQDLVLVYRRLDDEVGPEQLLGPVNACLGWVAARLSEAERHDGAFRDLCRVAAELSQLVGWLSFDMNLPAAARRHLDRAHRAAVAAGDSALAAYAWGWKSIVAGQSDTRAALALALAAQRQSGPDAAPSVAAWLTRVEAEALAANGDQAGSERALERVAAAAALPRTERDPSWTYFIGEGQIAAYSGVCFVRLGNGARAEAALAAAVDALPPTFTRDRCLYMTYLAAAHVLQKRPDVAASTAAAAFELAVATDSPRAMQRLRDLRGDLDRWGTLSSVQELDDLMWSY